MAQTLDCEIRFFSGETGLRLPFNPDDLLSLEWESVEAGGLMTVTAEVKSIFDDPSWQVQGGDVVEAWTLGTGETAPRARARVGQFEAVLDTKESRHILAYGLAEDMNHVLIDRILLVAGGADLSYFAGQIADDYAQRRPGLVFERDIQDTGITLERLEQGNATARQSMDQIMSQAGGNVVWGWDVNPATGLDRFYLRPKTFTIGNQWFVGDKVRLINAPVEMQNIVNGVKVEGGPAKYPQLVTNPSFEIPELPSEASGNILRDGGFEKGTNWRYVGGATRNTSSTVPSMHPCHTGNYLLLLDHTNEEAWDEYAVGAGLSAVAGVTYKASCFAARESGTHAATGRMLIEGRQGAGGTVLESWTLNINPASSLWTGGQADTVAATDALELTFTPQNSLTTALRVRLIGDSVTATNAAGLVIDDVVLFPVSDLAQHGWQTNLNRIAGQDDTDCQFVSVDWLCRGAAAEGVYGVRAQVSVGSHTISSTSINPHPQIAPYPAELKGVSGFQFKPQPNQALRNAALVRMSPGLNSAAGQAFIEYHEWKGTGGGSQYHNAVFTIPNDGAWHLIYLDVQAHNDAATAMTTVSLSKTGTYDIDCISCRDQGAGESTGSVAAFLSTFLRGTNFEKYVTSEEVSASGTAAYNSFSEYGRQEAVVSNDQIVTWNTDAVNWAVAYFQRNAIPLQRPRVDLTDEWVQTPSAGQGTQVRISGLKADVQDWCARAGYTFRASALSISMDLSNQRPTLAKLLSNLSAGGGGSVSGIAASARQAAAGGSGGGGSTSTASPVPVASSTVSGTVETNTDDSGGNPVVYLKSEVDALIAAVAANASGFPAWGIQGQDLNDGGTVAFNPSALVPTWDTLWPSIDGNLNFLPAVGGPFQPIAWEQRCVLQTRLKVATATTITIALYADNHCRVVLNGTTVGIDATSVNSYPLGTLTYSLSLSAGWNDLQLCYGNGNMDTYALVLTGWVSGASVPLSSLVDRMYGVRAL